MQESIKVASTGRLLQVPSMICVVPSVDLHMTVNKKAVFSSLNRILARALATLSVREWIKPGLGTSRSALDTRNAFRRLDKQAKSSRRAWIAGGLPIPWCMDACTDCGPRSVGVEFALFDVPFSKPRKTSENLPRQPIMLNNPFSAEFFSPMRSCAMCCKQQRFLQLEKGKHPWHFTHPYT